MKLQIGGSYGHFDCAYAFVRDNGERILFTPTEINFISHELERNDWRCNIEMEIESNIDSLHFDNMTEEEFTQECMNELESKWELGRLDNDPDYQCVVFDIAQENGIWRDN